MRARANLVENLIGSFGVRRKYEISSKLHTGRFSTTNCYISIQLTKNMENLTNEKPMIEGWVDPNRKYLQIAIYKLSWFWQIKPNFLFSHANSNFNVLNIFLQRLDVKNLMVFFECIKGLRIFILRSRRFESYNNVSHPAALRKTSRIFVLRSKRFESYNNGPHPWCTKEDITYLCIKVEKVLELQRCAATLRCTKEDRVHSFLPRVQFKGYYLYTKEPVVCPCIDP